MHRFLFLFILLTLMCTEEVFSQDGGESPDLDETFSIPYRPKLAEFSYNSLYEYNTYCTSDKFGNSSSEVERDDQLKIRLGIPMVMNDKNLIGVQLKYDRHNFIVDFDSPDSYELYEHIEERKFTSAGARLLVQRSLDNDRKITVIAGAEIKSDEIKIRTSTSKFFTHFGYSKRLDHRTKIGGGLMLSYTLGRPQIYPLLSYERQLGGPWTLDLDLPKKAAIRLKVNDKFYVTGLTEVKGWRYAIHNFELSGESESELTLRKSDINFGVSIEHEIYDWLWAGADFGWNKNLRYFLAKPGDGRRDAIIDLTASDAPYMKLGLFIVPPKKIYQKMRQ